MFDKNKIFAYIGSDDERLFFTKSLNCVEKCIKTHEKVFTDFSDNYKINKFYELLKNKTELNLRIFGGNDDSERMMVGFSPSYLDIFNEDFPIVIIKISHNTKFSKELCHRDYLGSILGLGINRGKVGDIYLKDDFAIAYLEENIADYVIMNLKKVSSTKVNIEILDKIEEDFCMDVKEFSVNTSSLRLDTILSSIFNLSRGKISELIKSEKAFVNWNAEKSTSRILRDGDIITLRGFGRVKFIGISGKTKKDRYIISYNKYSKK